MPSEKPTLTKFFAAKPRQGGKLSSFIFKRDGGSQLSWDRMWMFFFWGTEKKQKLDFG